MKFFTFILGVFSISACGSGTSNNGSNNNTGDSPESYTFPSRFDEETTSVSFSGQTFRHLLISDLKVFIGDLTTAIDDGSFQPTAQGEVVQSLEFYLVFDSTVSGENQLLTTTDPASLQTTYNQISSDKNLLEKLAGKDDVTDHKDWSAQFSGWTDTEIAASGGAVNSPEGYVRAIFETIEASSLERVNGNITMGPGEIPLPVHVTASGLDLQQLAAKFLLVAVAFSQGTDDYLDDDVDGKGLRSPNTQDEENAYTTLEHAWDEGFGYFGAIRAYGKYDDDTIAAASFIDVNEDGKIDLLTEYNYGASINAAKRDLGSVDVTDFSGDAFNAFARGREIIAGADDVLTDNQFRDLQAQRDLAVDAWEKAYAATVVHYINEVLATMTTIGTAEYDFLEHAKVWSEMKGFALGFQFNPRSPLAQFDRFHELVGDAPALTNDEDYGDNLLRARELLGDAYDFSDANLEAW